MENKIFFDLDIFWNETTQNLSWIFITKNKKDKKNFIKRGVPTQLFSCGFYEIFKKIFFYTTQLMLKQLIKQVLNMFVKLHFFSIWVFFQEHSRITGLQGKGEGISLTPHYHFHTLYRHLDISRAIIAESAPLHIASTRTQTGNLWFPSANR